MCSIAHRCVAGAMRQAMKRDAVVSIDFIKAAGIGRVTRGPL
jgi:hypothetical protein